MKSIKCNSAFLILPAVTCFVLKYQQLMRCHWSKKWYHQRRSRRNSWVQLGDLFSESSIRDLSHDRGKFSKMHNASGQSETLAPVYRTIYEITTNKSDPVRIWNLSARSQATWTREFNSMPNTVSTGVGLTHFPGWRRRLKCLQICNEVLKSWAHCGESGGPAVLKSSR